MTTTTLQDELKEVIGQPIMVYYNEQCAVPGTLLGVNDDHIKMNVKKMEKGKKGKPIELFTFIRLSNIVSFESIANVPQPSITTLQK